MKKLAFLSASVALVATVAFPTGVMAKPDLHDPAKVVKSFLEAKESGDVNQMEKYVIDDRYASVADQTQDYQSSADSNPLLSYKVVSKKTIDDSHVEFMVEQTFKNTGEAPTLPFELVKQNGEWKYEVVNYSINHEANSPNFGKITTDHKKKQMDATIKPNTTEVLYWSFSNLMPNANLMSSSTFSQSRSDGQVTLNGWQTSAASDSIANILYTAILPIDSSSWYTEGSVYVGGYYPSWGTTADGTWYTAYIQGVPKGSGYKMLFTNQGPYVSQGSGNAYE